MSGVLYVTDLASDFDVFFLPVNACEVEIIVLLGTFMLGGCMHAHRVVLLNKCCCSVSFVMALLTDGDNGRILCVCNCLAVF